jgi:hypothetical protein
MTKRVKSEAPTASHHNETTFDIDSGSKWYNSRLIGGFIITIWVFGIYGNTLNNSFIYDDINLVVENKAIRNFMNIPAVFTHHLTYFSNKPGKFFRPIQSLSFMWDYFLFGLHPYGYHVTNIILHAAVTLLFYYFAWGITRSGIVSLLAAILYLSHPVHTQAVTNISGRADPLCTIFLLLMLIGQRYYWAAVQRVKKIIAYFFILGYFCLALLSKELAVIFPFLLMLNEYCSRSEKGYNGLLSRNLFFYIPFFLAELLWVIIKNTIVSTSMMVMDASPLMIRLMLVPRLIYEYLRLSFFPIHLHMGYKVPLPKSILQEGYLGPAMLMVVLCGWIFYAWRMGKTSKKYRIVFLGIGWFFIALLPYLQIFMQLNAPYADNWLYIAEMGLLLSFIYLIFRSIKGSALKMLAASICIFCAAIFSFLTVKQNLVWKDLVTFCAYTLQYQPGHAEEMYNDLAIEYAKMGDLEEARSLFKESLKMDPDNIATQENLRKIESELAQRGHQRK